MSMDKDRLGNKMSDAVLAVSGLTPIGADDTQLRILMKALADEIIIEIDEHFQATGTTLVTSGSSAGTHATTIPEGGAS